MVADVVNVILDEAQVRPLSDQIPIYFTNETISYIEPYKIYNILVKLQNDESVVKGIICPERLDLVDPEPIPTVDEEPKIYNTFYVEINPSFELWAVDYLANVAQEIRGNELGDDYEQYMLNENSQLKIVLTKKREIVLNGLFLLSKSNFTSENEKVFSYLYQNPNKIISREELEVAIGSSVEKKFHKIIENLGFNPDLKKCFFDVGKNSIMFRNPVKGNYLKSIGIEYIRFS